MSDSYELYRDYMIVNVSETVTTSGTSGTFTARRFNGLSATINLITLTGTNPYISFYLEESDDGVIWNFSYNAVKFGMSGSQRITATRISSKYFRFSWIVAGTLPSAIFTITATLKSQSISENSSFRTQTDTFTVQGTGTIVQSPGTPLTDFTVCVTSTGLVTAWIILLEGSLDGINFSTIAKHTEIIGSGVAIFSGTNISPCLYFRTKCVSITLGLGTSVTATVLGAR